ncbi:MAG: DUF2239 family protein [Comamonadaceae bacterium]|nr:MAG: DUF2239 family protein [Comamonadaceae bacterium]
MSHDPAHNYTAFLAGRLLASGPLHGVALPVRRAMERPGAQPLVFSDVTGNQVDLDLHGSEEEVARRYQPPRAAPAIEAAPRTRGRPRMGVVPREVTLLPEHWQWLAAQPGGASVVLRKLVHHAMRAGTERERMRRAQERSYRVMVALAGDRPGFEEAARSLFAGDLDRLREQAQRWPQDVREHVLRLADAEHDGTLQPDTGGTSHGPS